DKGVHYTPWYAGPSGAGVGICGRVNFVDPKLFG
ncbi:hypothetical protein A2U01_0045721, partial [Trifolium medium]|nr:hypothetical protein [Trifolium medium]